MIDLSREQWDLKWCEIYEGLVLDDHKTPNQAIEIAYREMGERGYGERPEQEAQQR